MRSANAWYVKNIGRNYIAHLVRANEITGGALLTFHNLFFFNAYVDKMRQKMRKRGAVIFAGRWCVVLGEAEKTKVFRDIN